MYDIKRVNVVNTFVNTDYTSPTDKMTGLCSAMDTYLEDFKIFKKSFFVIHGNK